MDWIQLVWNMDEWRCHVETVVNFRVPQNGANFLLAEKLLAFKKDSTPCNFSMFVLFVCLFYVYQ